MEKKGQLGANSYLRWMVQLIPDKLTIVILGSWVNVYTFNSSIEESFADNCNGESIFGWLLMDFLLFNFNLCTASGSIRLIYRKESVWDDVYNTDRIEKGASVRRWDSCTVFDTSHL